MPRKRRNIEPDALYEITETVIDGEFLLAPSSAVNALVLSVLARALFLYPVAVYTFAFLSNHFHMILSGKNPDEVSAFIGYVKSQLARGLNEIHGRAGPVFQRRTNPIAILEDAVASRLEYVLSHGTKEGLVPTPLAWPGVTAARAHVSGTTLAGTWLDREALRRARRTAARKGLRVDPKDYQKPLPITLMPPPMWKDLPAEELRARFAELIRRIEAKVHAERNGKPFLGADAVLAQNPRERHPTEKKTPPPPCHTNDDLARKQFRIARLAFERQYTLVSRRIQEGDEAAFAQLPPGAFPPPRRWPQRGRRDDEPAGPSNARHRERTPTPRTNVSV